MANISLLDLLKQTYTPTGYEVKQTPTSTGYNKPIGPQTPFAPIGPTEKYIPQNTTNTSQVVAPANYQTAMQQWRANWDWTQGYKPGLSPNGDPLPYKAIGWDYNGNPSWGDGFKGWLTGLQARLTAPIISDIKAPTLSYAKSPIYVPPGIKVNKEQITQAQQPVLEVGKAIGEYNEAIKAGYAGTPTAYITRISEEAVKSVLDFFNLGWQATRGTISAGLEMGTKGIWEDIQKRNDINSGALSDSFVDALKNNPKPVQQIITDAFDKKTIDAGWQAGRVLYTSAINPMVREEYKRRYLEGENPLLLQQQLENPLAEMIGGFILDPLNIIGTASKAAHDITKITSTEDELFKVAPELAAWLKRADNITNDAQAGALIEDIVRIHGEDILAVYNKYDEFTQSTGLFTLTASGNRQVLGRRVGDLVEAIFRNNPNDVDNALEEIKSIYNMAKGAIENNPDLILTGLTTAKNSSMPRAMFGRAAKELGIAMYKITEGGEFENFLGSLKKAQEAEDPLEAIIKLADSKITLAAEQLFPTIPERIKMGLSVGLFQKAVSKFYNITQKAAFRPINTFFSMVYMGLSPGFAARNMWTNTVHLILDGGLGTGLRTFTPDSNIAEIKRWMGGMNLRSLGGYGGGEIGTMAGSAEIAGGFAKNYSMLGLSNKLEEWASTSIVRTSVIRSMRSMLKEGRAIPVIDPLVEAGMRPEEARLFVKLIVDEAGNVDKAATRFIEAAKTGEIDIFKTFDWINDADKKAMQDLSLWERIRDYLGNAKTHDEAIAAINTHQEDIENIANSVRNEIPKVSYAVPGADAILEGVQDGVKAEDLSVAADYFQANANAISQLESSILRTLPNAMADNPSWEQAWVALGESRGIAKSKGGEFAAQWSNWEHKIAADAGRGEKINLAQKWDVLRGVDPKLSEVVPRTLDEFKNRFWVEFYYPNRNMVGPVQERELLATFLGQIKKYVKEGENIQFAINDTENALQLARKYDDNVITFQKYYYSLFDAKTTEDKIRALAAQKGIWSETAYSDKVIINIYNKYVPEGKKIGSLAEADPELAKKAFAQYFAAPVWKTAEAPSEAAKVAKEGEAAAEVIPEAERLMPPYAGDTPSIARIYHESRTTTAELFSKLRQGVDENFGKKVPLVINPEVNKALSQYTEVAKKGINEARYIASEVAYQDRKFALLAYGEKTNFDLVAGYIFPYQFWYSRTYLNWMKRLAWNADVIAGYAKYKQFMAKIHAGAPEWWKYNINSNELLGLDSENPVFFNLETTLNPLQGLTGVDFNDPYKRVDWLTRTVDDLGKFGPSVWTPYSIAIALSLFMKGQTDAAARWGGRLIPQTATLKSILSFMNIYNRTGEGINEYDPAVWFFSGGLDPYERNRVARALGMMAQEGEITEAQFIEASRSHTGDIWYRAVERAIQQRRGGQLSSFLLGVGFKARNLSDIAIDQMYNERRVLYALRDTLSPEEYRNLQDMFREKYPWSDGVILARKGGEERDSAYAYNVLSRIPPGQTDVLQKLIPGFTSELIDKFYTDKGDFTNWSAADKSSFMSSMLALGAILDLPDNATRREWTEAKNRYNTLKTSVESQFGQDIYDKITLFYQKFGNDTYQERQDAFAYRNAHPEIKQAQEYIARTYLTDPLLSKYYTSFNTIKTYYEGQRDELIAQKLGENIFNIVDEYYRLKDAGDPSYKKYSKLVSQWYDLLDKYQPLVDKAMADVAKLLNPVPFNLRTDINTQGKIIESQIYEGLTQPAPQFYNMTWEEWKQEMSPALTRLVLDNILDGRRLNNSTEAKLKEIADKYNISVEQLLDLMQNSLR